MWQYPNSLTGKSNSHPGEFSRPEGKQRIGREMQTKIIQPPSPNQTGTARHVPEWWLGAGCGGFAIALVLLSYPIAECGFDDDWSYAYTALRLVKTGRITYDGWGAPMLFFQAAWGGMLIRIFGFSFNLLHLATVPFAAGCASLTYSLARRSGLSRPASVLASATLSSSPLFVPLAASFMTDVYGVFFALLCLYCGVRAFENRAKTDALQSALWLVVAVFVGLVGGANRQIIWAAPLVVLGLAVWNRENARLFRVTAVVLAVFLFVCVVFLLRWHGEQPYAVPEGLSIHRLRSILGSAPGILGALFVLALTAVLTGLPVFTWFFRTYSLATWRTSVIMFVVGGALLSCVPFVAAPINLLPLIGNIFTSYGVMDYGVELLGGKPEIIPYGIQILLIVLALILMMQAVAIALAEKKNLFSNALHEGRNKSWTSAPLALLGLFGIFYFALLTIPAAPGLNFVFDRYMLPVMPSLVIFALSLLQKNRRPIPPSCWLAVCLAAGYSVATTHDYYASLRARLAAFRSVEQAGVPRIRISGGFELDAETQLEQSGYLNSPLTRLPGDSHPDLRKTTTYWFWTYTPSIQPEYILSWTPLPNLAPSGLPPQIFHAWLPPFRRQVVILLRKRMTS